MSGPLALGAVTAVLRSLLADGIAGIAAVAAIVGDVSVTSVAPDTIRLDDPRAGPRLNLFLHRVSPDAAGADRVPPVRGPGGGPAAAPPLALDLHYLLTAYDARDAHAEILLGAAMSILRARPVLTRDAVLRALDPDRPGSTIPASELQAFVDSGVADQAGPIRVASDPLDGDALSRLWMAFRAPSRPSAGYVVSGLLIDAATPA